MDRLNRLITRRNTSQKDYPMKHVIYSTTDYLANARAAGADVVAICNHSFIPAYVSGNELTCRKCERISENYPADDRKRKRLQASDGGR